MGWPPSALEPLPTDKPPMNIKPCLRPHWHSFINHHMLPDFIFQIWVPLGQLVACIIITTDNDTDHKKQPGTALSTLHDIPIQRGCCVRACFRDGELQSLCFHSSIFRVRHLHKWTEWPEADFQPWNRGPPLKPGKDTIHLRHGCSLAAGPATATASCFSREGKSSFLNEISKFLNISNSFKNF